MLPVTLAHLLELSELVESHLDLGDSPGRANVGDKIMTLVSSALAGEDCIDDADALPGLDGFWAARSRRHPRWGHFCAAGDTCASRTV